MAFTCRPEECHELALQRVCEKYGYKTKQKALFFIIEQFENIEAERKALTKKVSGLESELSAVKQAVRRKIEADENLARCIDDR